MWLRASEYDKRFAWGDDYAGDAWCHDETGEIRWAVVGFDMNTVKAEDVFAKR